MTLSTSPEPYTASGPSATNAEPTTPPISACEEDDGSPKYQVARFHAIAPTRPANTIAGVISSASTMPLAIVAATSSEMNAPAKFSIAAIVDRDARRQRARRDRGRDRVGGVVEPVGEVERERRPDDDPEDEVVVH